MIKFLYRQRPLELLEKSFIENEGEMSEKSKKCGSAISNYDKISCVVKSRKNSIEECE